MKRINNEWLNALFTLIFIALPVLIGYYFWLPDWTNKQVIPYGIMIVIAIGFIFYVIIFTMILIYFKITTYDLINFNIPITIIFVAIFITPDFPIWARTLIVFFLIFSAFPINILTTKLKKKFRV